MGGIRVKLSIMYHLKKMRKYRRVVPRQDSKTQKHEIAILSVFIFVSVLFVLVCLLFLSIKLRIYSIGRLLFWLIGIDGIFIIGSILISVLMYTRREQISLLSIPKMDKKAQKMANKIIRLYNDKVITDILKLSNRTRYGDEMPEIYVYVSSDLLGGYVCIENIANYHQLDRVNVEQELSGILSGTLQKYAFVYSELCAGDTFVKFYFEDNHTSMRLIVRNDLDEFVSDNVHEVKLMRDLSWRADIIPHLSIIARTRSGKSVFAGGYIARLMLLQGWKVEYNSAKFDRYVKDLEGFSSPSQIVERAEHYVGVMRERLKEINHAGKDNYLDMKNMRDIGLFFDELGNLNAALELDKKMKTRWESAINSLSATGASAGIHIIAISQQATQASFLPSLARVNCNDFIIMLGGAANSSDERRFMMAGYSDLPKRGYGKGQGLAMVNGAGIKWSTPHFFETPWIEQSKK